MPRLNVCKLINVNLILIILNQFIDKFAKNAIMHVIDAQEIALINASLALLAIISYKKIILAF